MNNKFIIKKRGNRGSGPKRGDGSDKRGGRGGGHGFGGSGKGKDPDESNSREKGKKFSINIYNY